ncbi:MAG: hypothetical protein ACAI25_03810 [Planctomycetota bacterium]
MSWLRTAALVFLLLGLAVPFSASADDDEDMPRPKKDEKKKDDKKDEKKPEDKADEKKADEGDEKADKKDEDADKLVECEYYPLAVGTTWTYEVNGTLVKMRVAEHEKLRGVLCARVESEVNGATAASEHIRVTKDGVYRHSYNGTKIEPPLCFIKLPLKKGAAWKVKSKQGGTPIAGKLAVDEEDDVDVPLGTFKTFVVKGDFESSGQTFASTSWFVKGKGLVKQSTELGGQTINLELKKFKLGKGKVAEDEDDSDDEEKKPEGKKPGGKKTDKKDF